MKLKQRVGDFRVRELLEPGFLRERGGHRVYRVTKRKLTTPEAVRAVADLAGVEPGDVSIAGLKDRQGITIQHVSVPRGRDLRIQEKELKVETAGFADEPVSSEVSRGNAFEIGVRALTRNDTQRLRDNLPRMREHGVVNYFDDQRFGNLEFGQGWILIDLMRGEHEKALRLLLTGSSERDDEHHRRFKSALDRAWGDWRACREIAGKYGAHHSIFEHLGRQPADFLGAFDHVATRIKTIHLFAYQSHLWNRAVAELVRAETAVEDRVAMPGIEGPLISWADAFPKGLHGVADFPLPGPGLDDVRDPRAYGLLEDALAKERLVPDQLRVEGTSGFHLKGELRRLRVVPEHLRVRPAESDVLNPGLQLVRVRFELPRGAYATLVVKRLLAHRVGEEPPAEVPAPPPGRAHRGQGAGARPGRGHQAEPWGRARQRGGAPREGGDHRGGDPRRGRDEGRTRDEHPRREERGGGRRPAAGAGSSWGRRHGGEDGRPGRPDGRHGAGARPRPEGGGDWPRSGGAGRSGAPPGAGGHGPWRAGGPRGGEHRGGPGRNGGDERGRGTGRTGGNDRGDRGPGAGRAGGGRPDRGGRPGGRSADRGAAPDRDPWKRAREREDTPGGSAPDGGPQPGSD